MTHHPTARQRARRRQSDRDFLALVPLLSVGAIEQRLDRDQPLWRRVVLRRALERLGAR